MPFPGKKKREHKVHIFSGRKRGKGGKTYLAGERFKNPYARGGERGGEGMRNASLFRRKKEKGVEKQIHPSSLDLRREGREREGLKRVRVATGRKRERKEI